IGHNEKSITVGFAALHYANPYKNQYLYKLNGFDKEWIATDSRNRIASYSNLPDGQYVLQVKASNNDGVWNPQPIELTINVHPPWWGTWWFKISMIIAAALLFYLLMHLRMSIYRKTQKELTKLVRDRTQKLEETNELLLERQTRIEEQSEELRAHSEGLKEANDLLVQRQNLIKLQAEKLLETNEELVKLNSTKDRFFSIIAHDLRNPFHIVTGFTELLLRDYEKMPFDKVNKYLNLMYNSSRSGNNLLENLLQWSRTQTGTISYEPVHLNLFTIAKETFDYLEGDAHKKSIEVRLNIDRHLTVVADENMLKTILRNLLSNAIKFTYENGKIAVNTSMDGNMVEISITDTGVGIPVDKFPLLFKIETNISTRGTSQETGTGLGLILCKEFVEKHKGMIWVESKENEGTTFRFTLPIYQ
ncbi:MAG TPA: ATP-binding protein, partial [Bacteroidales bacterium]